MRTFNPGARVSLSDCVVLLIAGAGSLWVWRRTGLWWAGAVPAFVVLHFLLFCNVFRIRRKLELIWAGAFLLLSIPSLLWNTPPWAVTFLLCAALSTTLIAIGTRHPHYHGIGWKRWNPNLKGW